MSNENGQLDIFLGSMFSGKCLQKGSKVICYDGTIKKVDDLKNGDLLIGDDSKPRIISNYHCNTGKLFRIHSDSGYSESFTVTENHILSLVLSRKVKYITKENTLKRFSVNYIQNHEFITEYFLWRDYGGANLAKIAAEIFLLYKPINKCGDLLDISLKEYIKKSSKWKNVYKSYQKQIDFEPKYIDNDPYIIGTLIKSNKSRIQQNYLYNSINIRLELLAGIIDSKGYFDNFYKSFIIDNGYEPLSLDIQYLARSLGYKCKIENNIIFITGKKLNKIPTRCKGNICLNTSILNNYNSFIVFEVGKGEYISFSVDGNNRFLLSDFTVTHNSSALLGKLTQMSEIGLNVLYINHSVDNRSTTNYSTHSPLLKDSTLKFDSLKIDCLKNLDIEFLKKYNVIGIDEAQFFGKNLVEFVVKTVELHKKYVIVGGLDGDFRRDKIGYILDLIPYADNVNKLHAYCKNCITNSKILKNALFTHFKGDNTDIINIGGSDKYEPLCRQCYLNLIDKK